MARPDLSTEAAESRAGDSSAVANQRSRVAVYFDPRASPSSPTTAAAAPPTSIHIALSVGEPVKKREMSEPNEFDALTPKIISRIPPARSASESGLFMFFLLRRV